MSWVWLDDGFDEHPKFVEAVELSGDGDALIALWVRGLAYCNRKATDGVLPMAMLRRLSFHRKPQVLADALVSAGLWKLEEAQKAYVFHNYDRYQPSRAEVLKRRSDVSEAKRAAGIASGNARRARAEQKANRTGTEREQNWNESRTNGNPSPSPSSESLIKPLSTPQTRETDQGVDPARGHGPTALGSLLPLASGGLPR